jgi:hypothetical protein
VDLSTGRLTTIAPVANDAGGVGAMGVDLPWLVWEQLDSQTLLDNWSIHAWNQTTGASWVVSTSRLPDGTYVRGQQPLPVVRGTTAAWAQPIPSTTGTVAAEIRVVDLASRKQSTLDSGRLSSPVFAGPYLAWAKIDADGTYRIHAVDATSGKPVGLPDRVSRPGAIMYLGGSSQYLAWSTNNNLELIVWQVGTARYYDMVMPDTRHYFQFLQIAGHFVLWYTGTGSSVLDLTTGAAFDITGSAAGSSDLIVLEQPVHAPTNKVESVASRISSIPTSAAPVIPACNR